MTAGELDLWVLASLPGSPDMLKRRLENENAVKLPATRIAASLIRLSARGLVRRAVHNFWLRTSRGPQREG